jgi:hypothetical protein
MYPHHDWKTIFRRTPLRTSHIEIQTAELIKFVVVLRRQCLLRDRRPDDDLGERTERPTGVS